MLVCATVRGQPFGFAAGPWHHSSPLQKLVKSCDKALPGGEAVWEQFWALDSGSCWSSEIQTQECCEPAFVLKGPKVVVVVASRIMRQLLGPRHLNS